MKEDFSINYPVEFRIFEIYQNSILLTNTKRLHHER